MTMETLLPLPPAVGPVELPAVPPKPSVTAEVALAAASPVPVTIASPPAPLPDEIWPPVAQPPVPPDAPMTSTYQAVLLEIQKGGVKVVVGAVVEVTVPLIEPQPEAGRIWIEFDPEVRIQASQEKAAVARNLIFQSPDPFMHSMKASPGTLATKLLDEPLMVSLDDRAKDQVLVELIPPPSTSSDAGMQCPSA